MVRYGVIYLYAYTAVSYVKMGNVSSSVYMSRLHLRCALIYTLKCTCVLAPGTSAIIFQISFKEFRKETITTTKEVRVNAYDRVIFVMIILILLIKSMVKELYRVTRRGTIAVDGTIPIFTIFSRRWCAVLLFKIFCYILRTKKPATNAFFYSIEIINILYGLINVHIFNRNIWRRVELLIHGLSRYILFFLILILFPFSSSFLFVILRMRYIYLFSFKEKVKLFNF